MADLIKACSQERYLIMGIVNVTPDSFSDGGLYLGTKDAISHGQELQQQGAHILDIGGESTRPNAQVVSIEEEINRVVPVIEGLVGQTEYISIDTRNARTMQAAIDAGANVINDVSGLQNDPESYDIVSQNNLPVCIMHMQGTPETMQDHPEYDDVVDDLMHFFEERIEMCVRRNIDPRKIILDPGIGFGKTLEHNLSLLKNLKKFKKLGCPILLGVSRKSFIQGVCGDVAAEDRVPGSLAAALYGLKEEVDIFRVHDVAETVQAFRVYEAISSAT